MGDTRLNFSLEMFLCAILSEMVSFDADLHSKHEKHALCGVSCVAPFIIIDEQLQ